jgi:2-polyprenyl-6-methoxyphenol hydroxylase-like FAD-dependent oxidoreductase
MDTPKPEGDPRPVPADEVIEPPVERLPRRQAPPTRSPRSRVWVARALAIAADALQIVFLPLFGEGFASPVNDALDVLVGLTLVWLVGWHWAFVPSFAAELVPGLDIFPSWTTAVWFATRGRR